MRNRNLFTSSFGICIVLTGSQIANGYAGETKSKADVQAAMLIACEATIGAAAKDVWKAYTTSKGVTSWMVAAGTVDLRVGGLMRTSYTKGSDLTGPDVIENKILSFDPEKMISIQCVRTPAKFPFKAAIAKVWTVLYFEPVDSGRTKVTCKMLGFDGTAESTQMRNFFISGNQQELDALVKHFEKK